MKYLTQLKFYTLALTLFGVSAAYAQPGIDANRMNRDISIMENILSELFKVQGESSFAVGHISLGRNNEVRGTYLPGYGIIFQIADPLSSSTLVFRSSEGETASYSFVYSAESSKEKNISEASVKTRIFEFLRDYGSTIGQLKNDEHVMVIFGGSHGRGMRPMVFMAANEQTSKQQQLPVISVAAKKSDLDDYRAGRLSENQLTERFTVSTTERNGDGRLDLKVMANIFDTAFGSQEKESFRIRGSVNYLMLDNFGALFSFDVRYSATPGGVSTAFSSFSQSGRISRVEVHPVPQSDEEKEKHEQQEAERATKMKEAYHRFAKELKEYLVDYGRTLASVKSGQHILVSVTLTPSGMEEIPERIDVQVKKSTLEALDRGSLSRDEAIKQVVLREY